MKQRNTKPESETLRQKAEILLKKKSAKTASPFSEIEMVKLINELEVHQIELEMQNEELKLAKEQSEVVTRKYSELYDFAPLGYFTISRQGKIIEVNLCGSQILCKERSHLINSSFGSYVSFDTKPIFILFLGEVFKSKTKESCEITISIDGNLPIYGCLTGIVTENGEQCLVTLIDLTKRILAEKALKKKSDEQENLNRYFVGRELKMIELKKEINELLIKSGREEKY